MIMCLPCVMQTEAATQGSISLTLHSLTQTNWRETPNLEMKLVDCLVLVVYSAWLNLRLDVLFRSRCLSGLRLRWCPFIDIYVRARRMSFDITESYSCPTAYKNTACVSPTDLRLDEVRTWECQRFIVKHAENSETQRVESKSSVL